MFANILIWLLVVVLVILLIWLITRIWRIRPWLVRWPALLLTGLLALVLAAVGVLGAIGLIKTYVPTGNPPSALVVQPTPAMLQRGQHIADVFCASCHAPAGQTALIGGVDLAGDIPIPVGSFVSVNLTPGGPLKNWTDGEILRVLREGVAPDGSPLAIMGGINIRFMSDDDLHALIAYLRSLPAVDHPTQTPPDQANFIGILVFAAGLAPAQPAVTGPITAPPKAASVDYGQYILSYQDCRSCHGADLNGGTSKITPNGPSLKAVKSWTQAQFINTMRTGMTPNGSQLKPLMPYKQIGLMDDEELGAIYQYLSTRW